MTAYTEAFDTSGWNPPYDYGAANAAGYAATFMKCSQYVVDRAFLNAAYRAMQAGEIAGAYHFAQNDYGTPEGQAGLAVGLCHQTGVKMLALDYETNPGGLTVTSMIDWGRRFFAEVRRLDLTILTGLYGAMSYMAMLRPLWDGNPDVDFVWPAYLSSQEPPFPWLFQQIDWTTYIPGVSGQVDHDRCKVSADELRKLIADRSGVPSNPIPIPIPVPKPVIQEEDMLIVTFNGQPVLLAGGKLTVLTDPDVAHDLEAHGVRWIHPDNAAHKGYVNLFARLQKAGA